MKRISWRELRIWILASVLLVLPMAAHAGVADLILALRTVTTTLQTIGTVLSTIRSIGNTAKNLQQQIVWPITSLSQTWSFASVLHLQLGGAARQIYSVPLSSASLPNTQSLEMLLRGRQITGIPRIAASYTAVFLPIPSSANARAAQRNMVDMDDAVAMGSLKTAVIADQASQQMMSVASGLEKQTTTIAPGTAPFVSVQAEVSSLQNQAFLQKLLAAELREEATKLAHGNAVRKQQAGSTHGLQVEIQGILSRP